MTMMVAVLLVVQQLGKKSKEIQVMWLSGPSILPSIQIHLTLLIRNLKTFP